MMKSQYLGAFQTMQKRAFSDYEIVGDVLIVESLPREEVKTKSGIILEGGEVKKVDGLDMNRPTFVRVLAKGNGFYDSETGLDIPLEVETGDIILIGPMSVKWLSTFGPLISKGETQIGITRECEIQLRFKGQEGYERATEALIAGFISDEK